MAENRTSIDLKWDPNGRISHKVSGYRLPHPRDDIDLWVLAPSSIFYATHQLGVFRPSHGLQLISHFVNILFNKNYLLTPVNSTLKSARIDLIYNLDKSISLQFLPQHSLFHNNDSLEEGGRQLVSNYLFYTYSRLSEYYQIAFKTFSCAIVSLYLDFLDKAYTARAIGPKSDIWSIEFSAWSKQVIQGVSPKYYVPDFGQQEWATNQNKFLSERFPDIIDKHKILCKKMGIS